MSNGFFIDVTRCIACKACQIACKQWNNLPAEQTTNVGSYQNPPDFSAVTYKLVRMTESIVDGKFYGLYFPDQCRHCLLPPCLLWAQDSDAIYQDKDTGAVFVDRFMGTAMHYPANYGYIPHSLSEMAIRSMCW